MEIEFYKTKDNRTILTITRSDGSKTWSKLHRGIEDHDLAHFAVEETLHIRRGFYGIINSGVDIHDFEDKESRPDINEEALQVEYFVNLLQTEYWNAGEQLDILKMLRDILTATGLPMIANLSAETLVEIRKIYHEQILKLKLLQPGQKLHFTFHPF